MTTHEGNELEAYGLDPALVTALAAAQDDFPMIDKDATATIKGDKGTYKYDYATLGHIKAKTDPVLRKHGLMIFDAIQPYNGGNLVISRLTLIKTGAFLGSTVFVKPKQDTPQAQGGSISFGRRYNRTALLDLIAETDDDAQAAMPSSRGGRPPNKPEQTRPVAPPSGPLAKDLAAAAEKIKPTRLCLECNKQFPVGEGFTRCAECQKKRANNGLLDRKIELEDLTTKQRTAIAMKLKDQKGWKLEAQFNQMPVDDQVALIMDMEAAPDKEAAK